MNIYPSKGERTSGWLPRLALIITATGAMSYFGWTDAAAATYGGIGEGFGEAALMAPEEGDHLACALNGCTGQTAPQIQFQDSVTSSNPVHSVVLELFGSGHGRATSGPSLTNKQEQIGMISPVTPWLP